MVGGCCVCSDERGWAENPLVYCDGQGCTVAVHQGKLNSSPSSMLSDFSDYLCTKLYFSSQVFSYRRALSGFQTRDFVLCSLTHFALDIWHQILNEPPAEAASFRTQNLSEVLFDY